LNEITGLLDAIQKNIFNSAVEYRKANTHFAKDYDEMKDLLAKKTGFIEVYWDGTSEDEARVKDETKATVRLIPFAQTNEPGKCMLTGKETTRKVIFARAY
jgi:prolyl-tRNA synthetase